ncbi:hypothetical protein E4U21_004777 [Claviceps maximensis]|nr:hypothetical protein E4U21_004777 [Claviceps maximensis]
MSIEYKYRQVWLAMFYVHVDAFVILVYERASGILKSAPQERSISLEPGKLVKAIPFSAIAKLDAVGRIAALTKITALANLKLPMALVTTLISLDAIFGAILQLTVKSNIGGFLIGIVGFVLSLIPKIDMHKIRYTYKVGLDGAGHEIGEEPLIGAGGGAPGIRVYDNIGRLLGQVKVDGEPCGNGRDKCTTSLVNIKKQPASALFIGKRNPICIAAIGVEYPGGDNYGWVGNWAQTCGKPWYYSAIDAHGPNGTMKLDCAWIGSQGYKRGYTTALRIHFPEFVDEYRGNGNSSQYYCKENNTALTFFNHKYPKYFDGANHEQHKAQDKATRPPHKRAFRRQRTADISNTMWKMSVRSHVEQHKARRLCESPTSAGPSLVSMGDRLFCHMPEKVLYPFCEDVERGACWNHTAHAFDAIGVGAIQARAALPNIHFDNPTIWH